MDLKKINKFYIIFALIALVCAALTFQNMSELINNAIIIVSTGTMLYALKRIPTIRENHRKIYMQNNKNNGKIVEYSKEENDILLIDYIQLPIKFPKCEKCNTPLDIKTALNGSHRGSRFWGCKNFRKCGLPPLHLYNLSKLKY